MNCTTANICRQAAHMVGGERRRDGITRHDGHREAVPALPTRSRTTSRTPAHSKARLRFLRRPRWAIDKFHGQSLRTAHRRLPRARHRFGLRDNNWPKTFVFSLDGVMARDVERKHRTTIRKHFLVTQGIGTARAEGQLPMEERSCPAARSYSLAAGDSHRARGE